MPTLNIHRADGSIFERVSIKSHDVEIHDVESIARIFGISLVRDQDFYGILINMNTPIAMIYSGKDKKIVRVVFCDNHTNYEFQLEK